MKNILKKLGNNIAYVIIGIILASIGGVALANNLGGLNSTQKGDVPVGLNSAGNYQLQHPCSNGLVLAASSTSPTGWACVSTSGSSGLTSINGATGPAISIGTGTAGTIFNLASTTNAFTFNLPFASASNTGQLQSADWTTFNNKQPALSGGVNGHNTYWTGASTLGSSSDVFDNGTVSGVNATSSTINFNVQGTGSLNPFSITSSTGTSFLSVLANGRVGINTTTPAAQLTIAQNTIGNETEGVLIDGQASTSNADLELNRGNNSTTEANIDFTTAGADQWQLGIQNNNTNDFELWDGSDNPAFTINHSTLDAAFGTSTASAELTVQNEVGGTTTFNVLNSSGIPQLTVLGTGNIGIGTSTPSVPLVVVGSTTITSLGAGCVNSTSGGALYVATCASGGSGIASGSVATLIAPLIANGVVAGVNATTSTVSFTIQGSGTQIPLNVTSSTGTSLLTVLGNGNVGIGSSSPISDLSIQGTSGSNNLYLNIASSTGAGVYSVGPSAQSIEQIGTTSNASNLIVQGNINFPTETLFTLASSTGASLFTVAANGSTTISSLTAGCVNATSGGSLFVNTCATGTVTGTGTNGQAAYFTGSSVLASAASLLEDGTVAGVNATSSTVNFNIQGTGSNKAFQIASSTGSAIFAVLPNGDVNIGTSTSAVDALSIVGGGVTLQNNKFYSGYTTSGIQAQLLSIDSNNHFILFGGNANGFIGQGGIKIEVGGITIDSLSASLTVKGASSVTNIFTAASSTGTALFTIDAAGHKITGGTAPTCGTGCASVTGDDETFRAITGSGVTSVTVNFAHVYAETPACFSSDESGGTTVSDASSTPSSVTMNLSASLTTKSIAVICQISSNFTN